MDIFAGAGGLGDGFEAYGRGQEESGPFTVSLSAEMDPHAVDTLRTRAFYRSFSAPDVPRSYYDYAAGRRAVPWTEDTEQVWRQASNRACQLKLGDKADDRTLDERIRQIAAGAERRNLPWVLVGGPPCQAFSLVGRARNRGNSAYVPEADDRFYLYEHYLKILSRHRPAAFVLENVKGMLSTKIDGHTLFEEIFESLHRPGGRSGPRYRIVPVVQSGRQDGDWQPKDYLVRSERLGMPQTRHRVILLGIRDDIPNHIKPLMELDSAPTVGEMIFGLPELRSGSTDTPISSWSSFAPKLLAECSRIARPFDRETAKHLRLMSSIAGLGDDPGTGGPWIAGRVAGKLPTHLAQFIRDPRLHGVIQHEARSHMKSDLMRYAFAAAFAQIHDRSPKGAKEFPEELHPEHKSWGAPNRFVDRFKVQRANWPSSTVTSHLAKDGHYFIHPDPLQVRSLTVREAARLQTFPDNYIFEGKAGAQRKQVGNAVPPWLGHQIAGVIHQALK